MSAAPKKSLGQNFLINAGVCEKIARACVVSDSTGVIEIGPGKGALTSRLAPLVKKVVALELDGGLIPELRDALAPFGNVEIERRDALETDFYALINERLAGLDAVIAGNLPYYITSPIIMKVLESRTRARRAVFMVQKEAAGRLCAAERARESGAATLAVRWYSEPAALFDVSPGSFFPAPSITSSVISLELRDSPPYAVRDERLMFAVIKAAFAQRRKTAANAIAAGLSLKKADVAAALASLGLNESVRAERLGLEEYAALSDALAACADV